MSLSISTAHEHNGAVVVAVRGAIEHDTAAQIAEAVTVAVERHRPAQLYIDLGLVTYMDSAGVGVLVASQRTASTGGTRVVVRNASPFVRRLLEISGLGGLLV